MRWSRAVTVALLAAASALAGPFLGAAAQARADPVNPSLSLDTTRTEVPATVTVSGTCPPTDETSDGFVYPESATVDFPAAAVNAKPVLLDQGRFSGVAHLPATLAPATYTATLTCPHGPYSGSDTATADVTVLPPPPPADPTLLLEPSSADVGDDVTASGTCDPSDELVTVLLDGKPVGEDGLGSGGDFGPVVFRVPALPAGPHHVSTSCGATRDLSVGTPAATPTPTPTTPPTTTATAGPIPGTTSSAPSPPTSASTPTVGRVAVPDLTGLTEAQARDRLREAGLVLADREGTGRVSRQNPPAGTLTEPASAVRIVLAAESRPATGLAPLLIAVMGLLAVAAAVTSTLVRRGRRSRRERRWLDGHVSARLVEPRPSRQFTSAPINDAPGVSVRLQVRSASGAQRLQEVDRARAGAHAPGHHVPNTADDGVHG